MHKKTWFKIHLYLGLTAGVILMIIGVSGALLSFEKEILWLVNKDSYVVQVSGKKLSEKEIIDNFKSKFPEAKIQAMTINSDPTSSVLINIASKAKGRAARRGIMLKVKMYLNLLKIFIEDLLQVKLENKSPQRVHYYY